MSADVDGTPFGRYRLIELLGRGGMGEVWRAHDTAIDRTVAIKMLLAHFAQDEKFEQRFRREARAAARLDDPHVVPIYDVGEIDGRLYVAMRLINGQDLQTLVDAGPLEPRRAVAIVGQIAEALHAAHRVGLIHRDVKPSNILVTENSFAYLIDFGIARAAGEAGLTSTGTTLGTWSYMAPERFRTGYAEPSSDIYALACVLYECLTGELPFPAVAFEQIAMAHMTTPPPRPSMTHPDVPAGLDVVIATGMAKDPNQRYATTVELADAARNAITAPIERPTPRPTLRRPTELAPGPTLLDDATQPATPQRPPGRAPGPPPRPADRPLPETTAPPVQRWWRRQRRQVKLGVIAAIVVMLAAPVVVTSQRHQSSNGPEITRPTSQTQTTQSAPSVGSPVVLPFTGLDRPVGVAVDSAGTVYVIDSGNGRVLKLAAGSSSSTELPFNGLGSPTGVAVDAAGALYVTNSGNNRVLKMAANSSSTTEYPFTGLNRPHGVAVDTAGTVYITDGSNRVLKMTPDSSYQTVLPFTGLNKPDGVAVDSAGNLYVTDSGNNRVLKMTPYSSAQTVLPFTGLNKPDGVAVDSTGNLYVTDANNNRVLKLATGSTSPTVLPFADLNRPSGVAVDSAGNPYVTDTDNNRVVKW